jgi:hypothetical protein
MPKWKKSIAFTQGNSADIRPIFDLILFAKLTKMQKINNVARDVENIRKKIIFRVCVFENIKLKIYTYKLFFIENEKKQKRTQQMTA